MEEETWTWSESRERWAINELEVLYVSLYYMSSTYLDSPWQKAMQGQTSFSPTPLSQRILCPPQGLPPVECVRKTSKGRCWGGILIRCLNTLNWLISTWRSSSSIRNSLWMSELLTPSQRLMSPATLQRKVITVFTIFQSLSVRVVTRSVGISRQLELCIFFIYPHIYRGKAVLWFV